MDRCVRSPSELACRRVAAARVEAGWVRQQQTRFGRGAILERFSEPMRAGMDDRLTGTYLNPLDRGEESDSLPQRRCPSQIGGVLVRTHDEVLLRSLAA